MVHICAAIPRRKESLRSDIRLADLTEYERCTTIASLMYGINQTRPRGPDICTTEGRDAFETPGYSDHHVGGAENLRS